MVVYGTSKILHGITTLNSLLNNIKIAAEESCIGENKNNFEREQIGNTYIGSQLKEIHYIEKKDSVFA